LQNDRPFAVFNAKKWGLMTKNGVFLKKKPKKRNFSRKKLDKSHFTLYVM